jgi:hypothetical protein
MSHLNTALSSMPSAFLAVSQNEALLVTAGKVTRTVNSSQQVELGIKLLFSEGQDGPYPRK